MASPLRTEAPLAGDVHVAARTNDVPLMRKLLVANVDVNARDSIGRGPLSYAAENDASDVAKVLIENGADVNAVDSHGGRPLHCAARNSALNITKILIEAGADINAADECGRRPLHDAAEFGNRRVVAFLVDNGADLNAKDKDGLVALQLAERKGNACVIRLLGKNWLPSARPARRGRSSRSWSCTPRDFVRVVPGTLCFCLPDEDGVTIVRRDAPSALRRLRVDQIFADTYRIDSRFLSRKGLSRTAIDVESGQRVNLDFYPDPETLDKSLAMYNRLLGSEGVCRLIEKIDAHEGLPDCLVVERGDFALDEWLRTPAISLRSRLEALDSIAAALEELHGLNIAHGDLNPANITFFAVSREWKLQNLDAALSAGHKYSPVLVNVVYAAPELLKGQNGSADEIDCDPTIDMWSFGAIAFEVLWGRRLCEKRSPTRASMLDFIKRRSLRHRLNEVQDRSHRHFIKKFLKLDPSVRCTASEARASSLLNSVTAPDTIQALPRAESNGKMLQSWLKRLPFCGQFSSHEPRSSSVTLVHAILLFQTLRCFRSIGRHSDA